MSIYHLLSDEATWGEYLSYKERCGNMTNRELADLQRFINQREYLRVISEIDQDKFPLPRKEYVKKSGSEKKRVVYTYPREENYVLKLLAFLLLRRYGQLFAPNLYSFRVNHGISKAIKRLKRDKSLSSRYGYKVDIHDYFNSVDVGQMNRILGSVLVDEPETLGFITSMLNDCRALTKDGEIIHETKGIMAGMPVSAFLANLYLAEMDWEFHNEGIMYLRYSDDIIVFTDTEEALESVIDRIKRGLDEKQLTINPKKERRLKPAEEWTFLGIKYCDGVFDVSDESVKKICGKMRRKYRALIRWRHRKGIGPEKAAKAFVKTFNRKLYENRLRSDLTWTRWFFPVINTAASLRRIDHYMQDCVRYIMTERRSNRRYDCSYADLKRLGYKSLVNEYYKSMSDEDESLRQRGNVE